MFFIEYKKALSIHYDKPEVEAITLLVGERSKCLKQSRY